MAIDIKVVEREISTSEHIELINISEMLDDVVSKEGLKEGIVLVFLPHATAALIANEDEYGVKKDIINVLTKIAPPHAGYLHDRIDDNAHAHILSAILGQSLIFPVKNGRVIRGTWQEPFVVELDGPRSRRRVIFVLVGKFE